MTADVPALVLTGDVMTISNKPSGATNETWTSSNTSKASISNGIITVGSPGVVTLSYRSSKEISGSDAKYQYYAKHKKVLAGFPAMKLSASHQSGNQYSVTASCVSTDGTTNYMLNSMVSSGNLKYIWGYKNSSGNYNWCDTTNIATHPFTAPVGVVTHVCMKLYNGPGREGEVTVYDINRTSSEAVRIDPAEIFVNLVGYTMNYQYVTGLSSYKYLAVWCNPDYSGTEIPPDTVVIGVNSYSVVSSFNQTVNGDQVTVYCFDIKNDPIVQQRISDVRNGNIPPGIIACVFMTIKGSGTVLDNVALPVVSRIPGSYPSL